MPAVAHDAHDMACGFDCVPKMEMPSIEREQSRKFERTEYVGRLLLTGGKEAEPRERLAVCRRIGRSCG
jgi:hypothetical protein